MRDSDGGRGLGPRDLRPFGRAARGAAPAPRGSGRLGHPLLPPLFDDETPAVCTACRRGWIAVFEARETARGRRVLCPVCKGTGRVGAF